MMNILIVQGHVPHYRKPVFNLLSETYNLTVLHSGQKTVLPSDKYNEIISPVKNIGKFFLQSNVINEVHKGRYDVVVLMFDLWWLANVFALLFKNHSRIVYWGHRYGSNLVVNFLRDVLIRWSDGVILYTDHDVNRMVMRGIPLSKIYVAYNTMCIENLSDGSQCKKDSFIYVGRAQKRKRVDKLIVAFSEIISEIPKYVTLNIVGSGPENDYLKKLAEKCGVAERVVFHGEIIDNEVLKPIFQRAYAYVSPGHVGLGVLHSFAYGVPVVTDGTVRHAQEFDNLKDGENALLFKDYNEFKRILVNFCNNSSMSERLGKGAFELYSSKRSIGEMVKGFTSVIDNVTRA